MVGNKIDLEEERVIFKPEAEELARKNDMKYYDASAKENKNIDEFMQDLMEQVYIKRFAEGSEQRATIKVQPRDQPGNQESPAGKKKGCC